MGLRADHIASLDVENNALSVPSEKIAWMWWFMKRVACPQASSAANATTISKSDLMNRLRYGIC
jgi:hypothetical protein